MLCGSEAGLQSCNASPPTVWYAIVVRRQPRSCRRRPARNALRPSFKIFYARRGRELAPPVLEPSADVTRGDCLGVLMSFN